MSIIRAVFLGTPEFARAQLEFLSKDDHYEIVGVVTQPDRPAGRHLHLQPSPVKKFALEKGYKVISPEKITTDVIAEVSALKAEVAVVVAFGQILPQAFLDLFPAKAVNIHASLLPRWRGAAPIQRAIMAGDKETGVVLQVIVKKLDAGDVIGKYSLPISDDTDALKMLSDMVPLGQRLLHVDLMDYMRGHISPRAQDESLVTYAHKIDKAEAKLDLNLPARELFNRLRGLVMGPGSNIVRNGKILKLHKVKLLESVKASKPGVVTAVEADHFVVSCGQGALALYEVQPESSKRMSAKDYMLGHTVKVGDIFE
nr:methionyl-tRNA formyltransferase [uncultured bacterium]